MIKWITAVACAAIFAGCASQGGSAPEADQAMTSKAPVAEAAAADAAAPEAAAAEKVADADAGSRMVCKRHKPIGTNRIRKVCRTKDQWDAETTRVQGELARRQGRNGGCVSCGGEAGGG
ncbi:MAG: hypothetical protein AAGA23_22110 [Pseudomonadota bacterium]